MLIKGRKKMISLKTICAGLASWVVICNATSAEKPLIQQDKSGITFANGGFEQGKSGWTTWFKPNEAKWRIDKAEKHSGEASVLIYGDNPGRHFLVRKLEALTPGATYKISFWVKTENNVKSNKKLPGFSAVTFDFFPSNAQPRPYSELYKMRGTKPWKQYILYAKAPADNKGAFLCLIHDGGKIWFDDITLEKIEDK
jgi:hypothetical protein